MEKITSPILNLAGAAKPSAGARGGVQAHAAGSPTALASSSGTVELSASATDAFRTSAPVDRARVDAIRAAIANGDYPVDPVAIAARMVAMDLGE